MQYFPIYLVIVNDKDVFSMVVTIPFSRRPWRRAQNQRLKNCFQPLAPSGEHIDIESCAYHTCGIYSETGLDAFVLTLEKGAPVRLFIQPDRRAAA